MNVEIIYYFEKDNEEYGAFIIYDDDSAVLAFKHKEQYTVVIHAPEKDIEEIFYKPSEEVIIAIEDEIEKYKENEEIEGYE